MVAEPSMTLPERESQPHTVSLALVTLTKTGTTLVRQWRGHTHTVLVHKDGFEHEGQRYRSLTVMPSGSPGRIGSGPRFFGLTKRGKSRKVLPWQLSHCRVSVRRRRTSVSQFGGAGPSTVSAITGDPARSARLARASPTSHFRVGY